MNCRFMAYPAESEHGTVLGVYREPIGRKNGADLWATANYQTLLSRIEKGCLRGLPYERTKDDVLFKSPFFYYCIVPII